MVAGLRGIFAPEACGRLLIGLDDPDDAAVYELDGRCLIFTADYFPPVVDGAADYGAIAACNALGDVYAMGGNPLLALNLAAFPNDMPESCSAAILRAAAETVASAGAVVAGGHTTTAEEPSFGLAVVGEVAPERLIRKGGARAGEVLVLTKPVGVGVVTTAGKRGVAAPEHMEAAVASMRRLGGAAARAATAAGVRGGTDVTGFGLLGHLAEMVAGAGVGARVAAAKVPLLPGAAECAAAGAFPGGTANNTAFFGDQVDGSGADPLLVRILFTPETAGGLLLSVPADGLQRFMDGCGREAQEAWVIGEVTADRGIRVR